MARHLVTSALPYVNSVKHLGNLVGSLLPADVHARWLRNEGHEVLFVCGTDEHGAPAEIAAERAGEPVGPWCDRLHAVQRDQYARLGLSFDRFGRTSDPATRAVATEVYLALRDRGLVERRIVHQLYSPTDGRFLPDRYVLGACPHCGGEARGDQCDVCGRLLDPEELRSPRSALSGAADLERRPTEHVFLRLSALASGAEAHLARHPEWSAITRSTARQWLDGGLRDRCISRDLSWGTPVPDLPGKVFWCWFDAPLGYVGLTREADPDGAASWWDPGAPDTRITQFLGKDNVPFHAVWLPVILEAAGLRAPDRVHGLHWLLWKGEKFSTTAGRGVFLDEALDRLPADVWRWTLLAQAPETADTWFGWEQVLAVADKDLAGQLGNLAHRLQGLAGGVVPAGGAPGPDEEALWREAAGEVERLAAAHEALAFRDAIGALRGLLRAANRYVDHRAPWRLQGDARAVVLRTCFEQLRLVATAIEPVVPHTAARLGEWLGVDVSVPVRTRLAPGGLAGRSLAPLPPLFPRLG